MFHRVNMHEMLMDSATNSRGEGPPAQLRLDHKCQEIDHETGIITFTNGITAHHDLIVGADGIGSRVRRTLNILPKRQQSTSTCYHCVIDTSEVSRLGLLDLTPNCAIEFWGGVGIEKIVYSPCRNGEINSFYCFFPTNKSDHAGEGWNHAASVEELLAPFPDLDPRLLALFRNSRDIGPWRLFVHEPYEWWTSGRTCLLGDAAHPMLPDQSQGACQAIEDAAALGLVFSRDYTYTSDVAEGLRLYERIRKPRATKVQQASARAREDINERIGFSSQKIGYKAAVASGRLTIDEMNLYDMRRHVASEAAPEKRNKTREQREFVPVSYVSHMQEIVARM